MKASALLTFSCPSSATLATFSPKSQWWRWVKKACCNGVGRFRSLRSGASHSGEKRCKPLKADHCAARVLGESVASTFECNGHQCSGAKGFGRKRCRGVCNRGGGGYGKHQWLGQLGETTGNKKCSAFAKHLILSTY